MKITDGKKISNRCEAIIKVTMVFGAMVWTSAVFLRNTRIMEYSITRFLLGVAPNFGAVWMTFGLTYTVVFPILVKKSFDLKHSGTLILLILILLLASEVIHDLFLNAPFDLWDMTASAAAALLLMGLLILMKK